MITLPQLDQSCPVVRECSWTEHGRKHFPHRGLKKEWTEHGPARYLPGTTPDQIRALETATVSSSPTLASAASSRTEYARELDKVIGWDQGENARVSFAECSSGASSSRSFHGRPMTGSNHKLRRLHLDNE